LVGVLSVRSLSMVLSILAVWKAGGAYIPLDTGYPLPRITGILNDSGAAALITREEHVNLTLEDEYPGEIICLDSQDEPDGKTSCPDHGNSALTIDMNSLAYVIYTSGSTGKPKGVMVEHIGMMNHIQAKINDLRLTENCIVSQNASHTFDISVWQFFVALALGGKTVVYPDELIMEPQSFISSLVKDRVTILEVVPSYLSVILETLDSPEPSVPPAPLSLDYLLVTGEEIKSPLVREWFDSYPAVKMVNAYGPTEASDDITHYIMDKAPDMERIPIGKPLQNMNIYIVDNRMLLCPIGVKGEICVSGVGVGRGYLGDEQKPTRYL